MGFLVQVYRRTFPEGTLNVDCERSWGKYEVHLNGRPFAAGMESISEVVSEISATFRKKVRDSDEVMIDSVISEDPSLRALNGHERAEFVERAPLLNYAEGFLPN